LAVGVLVAAAVAGDLVRPVPTVDIVTALTVLGATVPEAPIYEDGDPLAAENDIGPAPQRRYGRPVKAVTETERVQRPPQSHLRARAFSSLGAHAQAHRFGGGEGLTPPLRHRK
jgi:hypothetical protein